MGCFRFNLAYGAWCGVAFALGLNPTRVHGGEVFRCIQNALASERQAQAFVRYAQSPYAGLLDANSGIHPDPAVRQQMFEWFDAHQSPIVILESFLKLDTASVERVLQKIHRMPPEQRAEIFQDPTQAQIFLSEWRQSKPFGAEADGWIDPVEHQGQIYEAGDLHEALAAETALQKMGVHTKVIPGPSLADVGLERDLSRPVPVRALIQILGVSTHLGAPKPADIIFESGNLNAYLTVAKRQGGSIVVDPNLGIYPVESTLGYYLQQPELHTGNWLIALRPNSNWSTFIHEWQHKVDFIDHGGIFPKATFSKSTKPRRALVPRALAHAGVELEQRYISELNAAGAQFKLYFDTGSLPVNDARSAVIYLLGNQRKVAIGRILQDPFHPGHYLLYIGSRFVLWGSALATYAVIRQHPEQIDRVYRKLRREQATEDLRQCRAGGLPKAVRADPKLCDKIESQNK